MNLVIDMTALPALQQYLHLRLYLLHHHLRLQAILMLHARNDEYGASSGKPFLKRRFGENRIFGL